MHVVIDVESWSCEIPQTTGTAPGDRFGCSLAVHDRKLWVVGGGYGHDLARSGHDLHDVVTLKLDSFVWSRPEIANRPHDRRCEY